MPVHDWTRVSAATYERAWRGVPEFWRNVVEGRASA